MPHEYQVIEINNRLVGFMKVVSSETEIYLGEIQITKDFQQQGIGTSLIKSVIQEAQANNKKL
ncbi:MAG TPA: GNAT family N-acetyltransferase [Coleofasciculaceae cyanobacterium]